MVGAVLWKRGKIIGEGWHHEAGRAHAEIEAFRDAQQRGHDPRGSTLVVTLEPCSTHGRTPPCTDAIIKAGVAGVVVGATDPNPVHAGRGFALLRRAGVKVTSGVLESEATQLNEAFNYWIRRQLPLVTVKSGLTLDGKIATASGESKWITSERSRAWAMRLRQGSDAIIVGINTVLADDASLTVRRGGRAVEVAFQPLRVVLDSRARTPLAARILNDEYAANTIVVTTKAAGENRLAVLRRRATVWVAPQTNGRVSLSWLLARLGAEGVMSALVEGGGEVSAAFFAKRLVHRVAFFYAPKVLADARAFPAVAGEGGKRWSQVTRLCEARWRRLGVDLVLTARVKDD